MQRRKMLAGLAAVAASAGLANLAFAARPSVPPHPRQLVVNGVVKAGSASGGSFVVHRRGGRGAGGAGQDVAVTTDANTKFLKSDGSAGSLADVVDNARVQVKGDKPAAGAAFLAKRVLIKGSDAEGEGG